MHESILRMDHPNLVVVHYNQYAGGKFFINCLAHHGRVLPGLCVAAPVHTYDHWIFESHSFEEKIQRKINRINGTIPERSRILEWSQDELGCQQFWGWGFKHLWSQSMQTVEYSLSLLNDYRCFFVNHNMSLEYYNKLKDLWPQAQHIVLHNESQFQQQAVKLKRPDYGQLNTGQLPSDLDAFYFNVDHNQFNKLAIINETYRCLTWLGLSAQVHDNIDHYVDRYFAIHQ